MTVGVLCLTTALIVPAVLASVSFLVVLVIQLAMRLHARIHRQVKVAQPAGAIPATQVPQSTVVGIPSKAPAVMQKAAAPSAGAGSDLQVPLLSADLVSSSPPEAVKIDMVD
jgi:hypothetical protein